jgi:basic membrane protein A
MNQALMNRRHAVALAAALAATTPGLALAQAKLKVAAIYTVPFEQQWVSRIHKALKAAEARGEIEYKASENVSNADYERVMREYATGGNQLIVGESFAVEAAARKVAKDFPKTWFLLGSSGKPQAPNFSVFDNYIQEPAYLSGMIAGGMTKTNKIGMVGGFPIPEVNRLMNAFMAGAKETNPKVEFTVSFINSWFDPPKAKEAAFAMIDKGADVMYAERFGVSDAAKEKGKLAIGNVINTQDKYPDTVVSSPVEHGAHHRPRAQAGQGRQVHRRRLRPVLDDEVQGQRTGAAGHLREEDPGRHRRQGQGQREGHPGRQVHRQGGRQPAQVDGKVRLAHPGKPSFACRASPSALAAGGQRQHLALARAPGEVLALLGENGAGKSTLVSILFGHYVADAGQIEVFGQPLPPAIRAPRWRPASAWCTSISRWPTT